jgi:hypothetical protein
VYQGQHYEQKDFNASYARKLIRQIPEDASVCASSVFVPHLCLRPEIYDFYYTDNQRKAAYLLITTAYSNSEIKIKSLLDEYEVVETDGKVYLMKKKLE